MKQYSLLFWLGLSSLFSPTFSYADVLIDVTATIFDPPCNIRSENSTSPLSVNFGALDTGSVGKAEASQSFSLYITDCNFTKTLGVELNPKGVSSLPYQGKNILATSTEGLGIDLQETTGGTSRPLEIGKNQRIYPERLDDNQYRMDILAQLVNTIPTAELKKGKFSSTVTMAITYF